MVNYSHYSILNLCFLVKLKTWIVLKFTTFDVKTREMSSKATQNNN